MRKADNQLLNCGAKMKNMLLASPVLSDAATITGSVGSGDFSIGNLKIMSPKLVYRVVGTNLSIAADLGASYPVNMVALIAHNGSPVASCRVRASDTNDINTAPFDSGILPMRSNQVGFVDNGGGLDANMFFNFFDEVSYRYFWFTIEDLDADFIDIGRLYISKAWQPQVNMNYGLAETVVDPSKKYRTVAGEVIPLERQKYRVAEFSLDYLTKEEALGEAFDIDMMRGRSKDVLFVVDPDEKEFLQKRSYYGNMEPVQPTRHTNFSIFAKAYRIEELPA